MNKMLERMKHYKPIQTTSRTIYTVTTSISKQFLQSLFESDDDVEDEDLEDKMASTDEEYKELVQVKNHKLQPKMSDRRHQS